ncbi:hypothetical protein CTAM01_05943 [Colletotrichum tamarilloi]|uniref:Transmembrane protein n=1 Tax=Colletotrichum tamarilloi TaxID=1209934 RepID=A0ABQ9RCM9_9PEZI|nr:uncharacterized protein CTAM01_05943 [Colletotrichum tamarilloi]KAI3539148.1 hypothetical protein CSPX01_09047 [Colletotrichum filicis]KAK1501218.1 hypothetical protein CTAM01_05943 [Colletotrichum tamarilloi]
MPESLHSRAVAKKSLLLRRRVCRTHRRSSGRRFLFALLRLVVLVAVQFINDLSSMSFVVPLEISIYLSGQGSQSLLIFLLVRQASRGLSGVLSILSHPPSSSLIGPLFILSPYPSSVESSCKPSLISHSVLLLFSFFFPCLIS